MELARPLAAEPPAQTSPLTTLRLQRKLTIEQAAKRAALWPEQVEWLEEGKLYRFQGQRHRGAGAAALRDRARDRPPRGAPALGDAGRAAGAATGRPLDRGRRRRGARRRRVARARDRASAAAAALGRRSGTPRRCRRRGRWSIDVLNGSGDINYTRRVASRIGSFGYRIQHVTTREPVRLQGDLGLLRARRRAPSPSAWPRSSAASQRTRYPAGRTSAGWS